MAEDMCKVAGKLNVVSPTTCFHFVNCLGTWNVKGINDTTKREDVVNIFKEGKFELLALTETKLKWKGEVS